MTVTANRPLWAELTGDERRDIIKPLWDAGLSAGDIMFHFIGASRNAIIGVVHRSNWQRSPSVAKANSARKNQERRKPTPNPVKAKRPVGRPRTPEAPAPAPDRIDWINTERPPLPGALPVRLIDLPSREGVMCRFGVQGGYCGLPSGDAMYCETHHRYVYSPPRVEK